MQRLTKRVVIGLVLSALAMGSYAEDARISISVQATAMRDVLKFIAEQSDTSIVISPEVSDQMMDVTIKDIPLDEALDVILKPYGCGHSKIGQTVVVDRLENLHRLSEVEPLASRVFRLNFLDAKGVAEIAKTMLSERGSVHVLVNSQKLGWQFSGSSKDVQAAKLERAEAGKDKSDASSQTLVVTDTPSTITRIADTIAAMDTQPRQIEIKSHFVEFTDEKLRDIGLDWGIVKDSGEFQTGQFAEDLLGNKIIDNDTAGTRFGYKPAGFPDATDTAIAGSAPYNAGMVLGFLRNGELGVDMMLRLVEETEGINVLSAPRIVAQENQEASIIVGRKVPIITTEVQGNSGTISTKLEYYERIGIQLNVIPQICAGDKISMVIHPAVTEQDGSARATLSVAGSEGIPQTDFPIIRTREAETRLTVDNGETVAIGGLVNDRQSTGEEKVPFLGDIPFLGRLFRRDVINNTKTELVILLKATIQDDPQAQPDIFDKRIDQSVEHVFGYWKDQVNDKEAMDKQDAEAEAEIVDPNAEFLDNMDPSEVPAE